MTLGLAACRLHFDYVPDEVDAQLQPAPDVAVANHDEDGDGIDDAIDLCPHIPDDGANADGDGVGDACDPFPAVPTESIAFFDPFTTQRSEWTMLGNTTPTYDGERITADTRPGNTLRLAIHIVPALDLFELGGRVGGRGTMQEQIAISARETGAPHFYCEIYDGGTARLNLSYTLDNMSFPEIAGGNLTGPIENAPFMLRMRTFMSNVARCDTSWPGAVQAVGGQRPSGVDPTRVSIYTFGLDVEWDYFIQIRTQQ